MPRLLFEIGCEELPAAACMEAALQLPELAREHLGAQTLERALHREAQVSGREVQTQVGFVEVGTDFGRQDDLIAHILQHLTE